MKHSERMNAMGITGVSAKQSLEFFNTINRELKDFAKEYATKLIKKTPGEWNKRLNVMEALRTKKLKIKFEYYGKVKGLIDEDTITINTWELKVLVDTFWAKDQTAMTIEGSGKNIIMTWNGDSMNYPDFLN